MGWTVVGPAVEIHAVAEEASLQATSTATVLLRPADLDGAAARLRLYGVDDGGVYRALPAAREWGKLVTENPCGLRERVITYLDAPRRFLAPFRFTIDGPGALTPTCIPATRRALTWLVPGPAGPAAAAVDVTYKDVSVVRLPDASWLLVAARYRTATSNPPRPPTPGGSLGDIVAWRAADPGFTQDVRGPYWLVDGQDALPGEARPAWLGVPGALITGDDGAPSLDVYYVVESGELRADAGIGPKPEPPKVEPPKVEPPKVEPPKVEAPKVEARPPVNGAGPRRSGPPDPSQKPDPNRPPDPSQRPDPNRPPDPSQKPDPNRPPDPSQKPDPNRPPDPSQKPDPNRPPDPSQKPDPNRPPDPSQKPDPNRPPDPSQKPVTGLAPGVALKRFDWAELRAVLAEPPPLESAWELTDAVPGALLGRVRVWSAARTPGAVRPFEAAFSDGPPLRFADPAPFSCGDAPADLFLAAIPQPHGDGPNGHGVWHAAGLPTGATLCAVEEAGPCTATPAVAGLDFLIAAGGPASRSRIAASTSTAFYVDPDPLRLPLGALHVAFGDIDDSSDAGLLWARGAARDVCRPWDELWGE